MGTEVLRPQDCLVERFRVQTVPFHRRKCNFPNSGFSDPNFYANPNPKTNRRPAARPERSEQKKRASSSPEATANRSVVAAELRSSNGRNNNGLVMGQVTLLRRGESLDSLNSKIKKENSTVKKKAGSGEELAVCGTGRIGPDQPEMVPKQIHVGRSSADVYAGSAFSMSPSPSSLPLPSFFNKKRGHKSFDDSASRDLRRLLRLE